MSLADIVRSSVAVANRVTGALQANITLAAWTGDATSGAKPTYATAVTLPALIKQGPVAFRTSLGEVVTVKAVVHILQPVTANGSANRDEPIDPRDKITLPNGTVGSPIMGTGAAVDPSTSVPYFHVIALG